MLEGPHCLARSVRTQLMGAVTHEAYPTPTLGQRSQTDRG